MSSLKTRLDSLASSFATEVVRAIQSASLEELLGEVGGVRRGPGRPNGSTAAPRARVGRKSGRLPRRSADDIAKTLERVVSLVKRHKQGMRAEQIRTQLRMQAKEMPRVLKEGLSKRMLKSKGQKRATTYFAT
jgi:hypothetical protein